MNPELLKEYIQNPAALNKESLTVLNELAEQFPYCQLIQMLVVKNLHNLNHFQYSLRLKLGAAYATDRKVLHALISNINEDITQVQPKHLNPSVSDTPVINLISPQEAIKEVAITPAVIETPIQQPEPQIIQNEHTEPRKLTAAEIVAARLAEITGVKEPEIIIQPITEQPGPTPGIVENAGTEQHNSAAEHTTEEVNIQPETTIESPQHEIDIIPAVDYEISTETAKHVEPAPQELKEEDNLPAKEVEPVITETKNEFHSFSDWLKNKKEGTEPIAPVEEPKQEIKEAIAEKPLVSTEAPPYKDLIERFIETEPRIQPARGTFYSPVNMARQSAVENDDIISETLAKIYYQQGNLHKALHMYEKLSLKYPEKIIFFAAQIETIKKSL